MDGDSGIVEIKDNKQMKLYGVIHGMEALIMIHSQFLFLIYKKKEYAICFTGIKINHAVVRLLLKAI